MSAENPFAHPLTVTSADIDEMGHVNNVVYVRWVQEVAAAHWHALASAELKAKYAWVVLRHEIDYKNPAFLHDEVTGYTWVGEHHGARFDRLFPRGDARERGQEGGVDVQDSIRKRVE